MRYYSVRIALWIGFGLVTGLFFLATIVTVLSLDQVVLIEKQLTMIDHARHHGHLVLADIQEQYIHQVHTIIIGNLSHMEHYNKAYKAVQYRISQLKASCDIIKITHGINDIQDIVEKMDLYFRETVLSDIRNNSVLSAKDYHLRLEHLASSARNYVLDLNRTLENKSLRTRARHEVYLRRTRWITIVTLLLALLMAIIVAVSIVKMIGVPISRIHEAFGSIGAGDPTTRIFPEGPRELKELAIGFNKMADDLEETNKRIILNERMAVMGEISAGVAHELNNPLGVITGYLKLVRRESHNKQLNKDLEIIGDEIKRCKEIVQGLLSLARPYNLDRKKVDLSVLITDIIEKLKQSRESFDIDICFTCSGSTKHSAIDDTAIRSVMNNILGNAIDAVGKKGKININLEGDKTAIIITVSDSGPGIAPDIENNVFKPFKTTKPNGLGLGLAISMAIIKSHGGRIDLIHGDLGGASFRMSLPR